MDNLHYLYIVQKITCNSGSSLSIGIGVICGYNAQHIGVAKVNITPHNAICKGAGAHFIFFNRPLLSIASTMTGVNTI